MGTSTKPAIITKATNIVDSDDVLAAIDANMIHEDKTVSIDAEGIAADDNGNFYIAAEGKTTADIVANSTDSLNYILKVTADGTIKDVISLPSAFSDTELIYGLQGLTYHPGGFIYAILQHDEYHHKYESPNSHDAHASHDEDLHSDDDENHNDEEYHSDEGDDNSDDEHHSDEYDSHSDEDYNSDEAEDQSDKDEHSDYSYDDHDSYDDLCI